MGCILWLRRRPKGVLIIILSLYFVPIWLIGTSQRMQDIEEYVEQLDETLQRGLVTLSDSNKSIHKERTTRHSKVIEHIPTRIRNYFDLNQQQIQDTIRNHTTSRHKPFVTPAAMGNNRVISQDVMKDGLFSDKNIKVVNSLHEAEIFMRTVNDVRNSPRIVIEYGAYTKHEPNFIDSDDRQKFYTSPAMKEKMRTASHAEVQGIVEIVHGGTYKHHFDCGWLSQVSYIKEKRTVSKNFDILVPVVLDTAYIFQHFYASTIPKLTQIYEYVRRPEVKILLEKPTKGNDIIYTMLNRFNISEDKIEWHTQKDHTTVYGADNMLFTCNAPPTHPELWKRIRNYIGVHDDYTVPHNETKIMFMSRKKGTGAHSVRQALNEDIVLEYLRRRYGEERVMTFPGSKGLESDIALFSTVSIMIGVHGGAFYNLNFATLNTAVIEFVPTIGDGKRDIAHCSTSIFWIMADLLGQNYWRVQSPALGGSNNVNMDMDKLERILDKIDAGINPRIPVDTSRL